MPVSLTLALDGNERSALDSATSLPRKESRQYPSTSLLVQRHSNFMRDDAVTTLNHLPIYTVSYRQLESSSAPLQEPQQSQFLTCLLRSYNSQWQTNNEVCIATACAGFLQSVRGDDILTQHSQYSFGVQAFPNSHSADSITISSLQRKSVFFVPPLPIVLSFQFLY